MNKIIGCSGIIVFDENLRTILVKTHKAFQKEKEIKEKAI